MNITYPPIPVARAPISVEQLGHELTKGTAFLLIPTELLYFAIYFHNKGLHRIYEFLTILSLATFWLAAYATPISCGSARCLQHFAVAIGTMKLLDIWARQIPLPIYSGKTLADWKLALIILTELRYESFTPNHIRVSKDQEDFDEPTQLGIHVAMFAFLQALPQNFSTVLAFEVMLGIYILWTGMQLLLRYKNSPALFGPLYRIDSLTGFWSESWHNAFASPCTSLAYVPLRHGLPKFGVPVVMARSLSVLGAFNLMAIFHMYALSPILDQQGLLRMGMFFFLNGVATVSEAAIWGHKKHWVKTVLAWTFETIIASWAASGLNIPNGLSQIRWMAVCEARTY
ncbi:uncharacterized protein RAG0_07121 [Rhynchosporium agropyri]|uniref:Wax synthase domain-containing protein n=1 Tax=Rhynchosporium agropyri TaxID=914238 RepID=A0A1E1KJX5_9HELO|nr:uncharacterized protein RAG0_07121 [Rhynchosporium agropyri]